VNSGDQFRGLSLLMIRRLREILLACLPLALALLHQGIFGLPLTIDSACGLIACLVVLPTVPRLIAPGFASVVLCPAPMPLCGPKSLGSGEGFRK
jgi:hypothetical protein